MLINDVLKKGRPISDKDMTRITEFYTPLVRRVTMRTYSKLKNMLEFSDALQCGYIGFLHCVNKYDPEPGVPFKYYAFKRIRGSIIDHVRQLDHVTRHTRRHIKSIDKAANVLEGISDHKKTDVLSKYLGLTVEQITTAQSLNYISREKSLDLHQEIFGDNELIANKDEDATEQFNNVFKSEMAAILEEKICILTPREEFIIRMIYFKGLTACDVSDYFNCTDSRISQIHNIALKKLRFMLMKYKNLDKSIK